MHTRICVVCAEKQIMHTTSFTSFTTPSVCILLVAGIHTRICVVCAEKQIPSGRNRKGHKAHVAWLAFLPRGVLLLLYCCFPAAFLLLSCCFPAALLLTCISFARQTTLNETRASIILCFTADLHVTAALLLLYCCFTAAVMLTRMSYIYIGKRLWRKRGRALRRRHRAARYEELT